MKWIKLSFVFYLLLIAGCSENTHKNSLSWYARYFFPLSKNTYSTQNMLLDSAAVLNVFVSDSGKSGDTLRITYQDTNCILARTPVFWMNDIVFTKSIGPLTICKTTPVACFLRMPDMGTGSVPIVKSIPVSLTNNITIPYLDYAEIDSRSDTMILTISNQSETMSYSNIRVDIWSGTYLLVSIDTINNLAPLSEITAKFSLCGKRIENSLQYKVLCTLDEGSVIVPGYGLDIEFTLNGQTLKEAVIDGRNLSYAFYWSFRLPLTTDTFNVDYFDVSSIDIPLAIDSRLPVDITARPFLGNAFDMDYCKREKIASISDINDKPIDSAYYVGGNLNLISVKGTTDATKPTSMDTRLSLGSARFLPVWNPKTMRSELPVTLWFTINHTSDKIKITPELGIDLYAWCPTVSISGIHGTYNIDKCFKFKPAVFTIPLLKDCTFLAELRKKFRLVNNHLALSINYAFPDNTWISQKNFRCILQPSNEPETGSDTLLWSMSDIKQGSPRVFNFPVNHVVNSFPDSIFYMLSYTFPKGMPMTFGPNVLNNQPNFSTIDLYIESAFNLVCNMAWEVSEAASTHLPTMQIPLNIDKNLVHSLEKTSLGIDYSIFNQTNINCRLFALAGTAKNKDQLLSLKPEEITPDILYSEKGKGLIPLLGSQGFTLPGRKDSIHASFTIKDSDMHSILESDSLYIRSTLFIPPVNADALRDTDYVWIDSRLRLEGVQTLNPEVPE